MSVAQIIKKLKISSPGWDGITVIMLHPIIEYISPPLTNIINKCLNKGIFPNELKIASVTPIFKKGDNMEFTNYRPISVLPVVSKVFDKIIYSRLHTFIENPNILYQHQYGFRKKYSIDMALTHLTNKLSTSIDNNETTMAIFIDLSKAFDTINHNILLKKLEYYGIRGTSNDLIRRK